MAIDPNLPVVATAAVSPPSAASAEERPRKDAVRIGHVSMVLTNASWAAMALCGALLASTNAAAQTKGSNTSESSQIEEVVVTATRRLQTAHDVPMSISALSEAQLQDAGALYAKDVVKMVPGLAYTEVNSGQAVLAVRGVSTTATFGNVQQPVALYYDDVPVLDLTIPWTVPRLQLFDVERVEVLRGPQGTLFGAGALSGAVRVIYNKPNLSELSAAAEGSFATVDGGGTGYNVNMMVNAPVVRDQVAVRVVGHYDEYPGWVDNPTLNENETNRGESYGGRIATTWKPSEDFELIATAAQEVNTPHDSVYVPYGSDSDTANFRVRTYNTDKSKIYNLGATYSMPWATLTSSTSYIDRDATSSMDFSEFANLITGLTAVSPLVDEFQTHNFLQEVRLASAEAHPFNWIVGAFYENYGFNLHETITQDGVSDLGYPTDHLEDIGIHTSIEDYAVFGEASYDLASRLTLTAGARYSHYSIKTHQDKAISGETIFDGPPSTLDRQSSDSAVTPKVSLSYKASDDVLLYALAAKGFRTGNSNLAPEKDPFTGQSLPPSYEPDSLWNYEVGTKLSLLDRRLTIDAAVFYIDWQKIQLQVRAPSGFPYTDNAGSATSKGVELQILGRPTSELELGTSLTYTDAKLDSVSPGVPAAKDGDQLPGSAPFTAYVYGQYGFALGQDSRLLVRLDYAYTDREYSDLGNKDNPSALKYGNYSDVGGRVTLRTGKYEFGLFAQNIANSREPIAARQYFLDQVEARQVPRTIGVTVRASW